MPNYDYKCLPCKLELERCVPIMERDQQRCPNCKKKLSRLFRGARTFPQRFPYIHHTLDAQPVLMTSRQQEAHEFSKRGLINGN